MSRTKERGFHVIELVLVLAVVAIIGFVGYVVMKGKTTKNDTTAGSTSTTEASEITSTQDLNTASQAVDELDTSSDLNDMTKIEQELDAL
jgi:Tfp pilus assembly protein FimT